MRKIEEHEIPKQLFEIPEPPKELWIEGEMPSIDSIFVTVVGSRKCSLYGQDAVQKIIHGLTGYPIVIVSGLALGVDTHAHEAALFSGLKTIAFPGSGLDNSVLYPKSNWQLANKIIQSHGALISELSPTTPAAEWTFPRRNRLMAGISHVTLIVEAEEKSGTLITARLALDYNRELVAVPGSIFSPTSIGTNRLIREGAHPITSAEDLLHILGFSPEDDIHQPTPEKINISKEDKHILDMIGESIQKDVLLEKIGLPISQANMAISLLELKGLIKEDFGEIRKI